MSDIYINILVWAILWGATWGTSLLIAPGWDYAKHYIKTSLYFLAVAAVVIAIFRGHILDIIQDFTWVPLIVLGVVTALHVALYYYLPKHLKEPTEYFQKYPKRKTFLRIDFRRLLAKSMELFLQQVFIVLLTLFLKDAGLTLGQIIIAFAIIFGVFHIPLIIYDRGWPSYYFIILSFLSAIIFPMLILKVNYGFVYSYIAHWIPYMMTAVGFWIVYAKRQKNIHHSFLD